MTQLTQDLEECDDPEHVRQVRAIVRPDAALNCHFHLMQNFVKKHSGFASLFDDPSLSDSKNGSIAYKQIQLIHRSKTLEQRKIAVKLLLQHWRNELGEQKAAARFEKEYCTYPYWNWNYACTGQPGVYPTNCPNESLNHLLKETVQLNVALPRLLVESLPNLLREDANLRFDPCKIQYPKNCSSQCLAVSGFMREGIDIVPLTAQNGAIIAYACNLRFMIGTPIIKERIDNMHHALMGRIDPFCGSEFDDNTPGAILKRYVGATEFLCCVTINEDGDIIGDCENCYKHLGWDCPAATYIRNKHGKLSCSLETQRKVPLNAKGKSYVMSRKGNTQLMYTGGLSQDGRRPRQCKPMSSDFKTYLSTLPHETLAAVIIQLGVATHGQTEKSVKKWPTSTILHCLNDYYDNPRDYRLRQAKEREGARTNTGS